MLYFHIKEFMGESLWMSERENKKKRKQFHLCSEEWNDVNRILRQNMVLAFFTSSLCLYNLLLHISV